MNNHNKRRCCKPCCCTPVVPVRTGRLRISRTLVLLVLFFLAARNLNTGGPNTNTNVININSDNDDVEDVLDENCGCNNKCKC